jgi:tetrahydromethanopterin S-methyltransferase subunit G
MTVSNLEKQQAKLEKINEKIKQEKKKIDQRLGHEIIKNLKVES